MRLPRPDCIGTRNDTPLSAGARRLIPLSLRSTPLFLSLRGTTVPKQSRWGAQWWLDRHIPIASGLAMIPSLLCHGEATYSFVFAKHPPIFVFARHDSAEAISVGCSMVVGSPRPDCIGTRNDTLLSVIARRLIPLSLRSTPLFLSLRGTTVPKQSRWGAQASELPHTPEGSRHKKRSA
jgi:hypothetical protein